MRNLQKVEMTLACLLPIAALFPTLWTIGVILTSGMGLLAVYLDSRMIPLYILTIGAPVLGYSLLGLVGFLAGKRDSKLLTGIFCIVIVPVLALSGFLLLTSLVGIGFAALYFYAPAPLIAIILVPVSLTARFITGSSRRDDKSSDLV